MQISLVQLFSLIDLTSLNDADTESTISALCKKAVSREGHYVAAVCVYPQFVSHAKKLLAQTPVKIATVANFPFATDPLEHVISEIKKSVQNGAQEIDVVFPYQQYLSGEKESSYDFIRACKAACGESVLLKVILETGALENLSNVTEVSYNVCHAGADFLKTSTGKIPVGATPDAAEAMLKTIKKISRPIGFKVSGGVRTLEQAAVYIELATQIMGVTWVTPRHFRIGASQLVDAIW